MLMQELRTQLPVRRLRDAASGRLLTLIILRTSAIVVIMAALLLIFVILAARDADRLAIDRQQHLIATVLEQNIRMVAHDQEAATVWEDSVRQVRSRPLDMGWLDSNLGVWFNTYYGHDEVFVLDDHDRPIYAMQAGRRSDPRLYERQLGPRMAPLVLELRAKLLHPGASRHLGKNLTPGTADVAMIGGHPAIVSLKPILSDSARFQQIPGQEYLHVSVRYLDGKFAQDLAGRYDLDKAHFALAQPHGSAIYGVPIRARSGETLGYFVWDPFRPGSAMFRRLLPTLIGALLLVFGVVILLLRRIGRNALQLTDAKVRAQHLAHHDPLTGLANRALFDQRLAAELDLMRLSGESLALLYIDLDHFKDVNDNLGHPTGDALICEVAQILLNCAAHGDTVARLGGDEFAIITVRSNVVEYAAQLCRDIARALSRPLALGNGELLIRASIGIAVAPRDAADAVELVRKADIALYDAKSSGRGRHSFFSEDMGESIRYRHEIERDLRDAVLQDSLSIVYQPYFDARTGALTGFEALLRWNHPRLGAIWPQEFIPIAEECGLIEVMGEWVLEEACKTATSWPVDISVNLSAIQLRNPALTERVFSILKRNRMAPGRLELEITETSFLECDDICRANIGHLRDIGVRISLDDFGTGYSSFQHLHSLEVDRLKIDQTFISVIDTATGGSPVVQAIVDLARASGIKTTAEGVETPEQLQYLSSIGCHTVQGYLLGKPMAADDVDAFVISLRTNPIPA
jgi:diguanylate cyclase (GGDEF)-like protein